MKELAGSSKVSQMAPPQYNQKETAVDKAFFYFAQEFG